MATAVIMPRQGQSVESCVIGDWGGQVGEGGGEGGRLLSVATERGGCGRGRAAFFLRD